MSEKLPLRARRSPRDRAAFPTELPVSGRVPAGISETAYSQNREFLSVIMVRFMTTRLRAMYQAFDGDLTLALVLGEIAMRNLENYYPTHHNVINGIALDKKGMRPCNALSISDVTGVPRETVRRKLAKLQEFGWIEKTPGDMYIVSHKLGVVFAAFDDSQTCELLNTADQIKDALEASIS